MENNRDLIIGIDGNALVHRAFHAFPPTLQSTDGIQTNAVYGFTSMLLEVLNKYKPKYIFCAFDSGKKTFRHNMYPEYKAHRKPIDESLISQFKLVEDVLNAFNIPIIKRDEYEADDILGTFSKWVDSGKWKDENVQMYIVTGDRDLLQLIKPRVSTIIPDGGFKNLVIYDRERTYQKYGYYPEQVVDFKAIAGDPSDNIPGVKGVGEKTVIGLLKEYNTLGGIYNNLDKVPSRYQTKLREGIEQAEFSKQLATVFCDIELSLGLNSCLMTDFDSSELVSMFSRFNFKSLVNKIPKSSRTKIEYDINQLDMFTVGDPVKEASSTDDFSLLPVKEYKVKDIAQLGKESSICVVSYLNPEILCILVDNLKNLGVIQMENANELPVTFVNSISCETKSFNFEELISLNRGVGNMDILDLTTLSHHMSSGDKDYGLQSLAFKYLGKSLPEKYDKEDINKWVNVIYELSNVLTEKMNAHEILDENKLYINKGLSSLGIENGKGIDLVVKNILVPISVIVGKMENRGIRVEVSMLEKLKSELETLLGEIEKGIYYDIGHEVNLNSPKQLSEVLYNELSLPTILSGKNKFSTREEVLDALVSYHPAISKILEYRELNKVLSTYVLPLLEIAKINNGDIHSDFKQTGSSSGRFASTNPNLQNLPIGGKWGDGIRDCFVAREGYQFVGADYSQMEFRVMADISQDSALISDFVNNVDIHKNTASRVMNIPLDQVTKEQRSFGKTINFGILFGQTPFGLSRMLKISQTEAKQYIEEYFKEYSGVAQYIENAKKLAYEKGWVQSMFGRTRYISGLRSRVWALKEASGREAVNMPIQGGEADIMHLAMILSDRLINEKYCNDAHLILQIHDEVIFEVKKEKVNEFKNDILNTLKNVIQLSIPLDVNVSSGNTLKELK